MSREFIKELRGDVRKEAIDIYNHIDKKELRESYLARGPASLASELSIS
jgi:integrase/recombinase XerD